MILVTLKSLPHFKHSQPFSNKFTYRKLRQFYFSRKNYKKIINLLISWIVRRICRLSCCRRSASSSWRDLKSWTKSENPWLSPDRKSLHRKKSYLPSGQWTILITNSDLPRLARYRKRWGISWSFWVLGYFYLQLELSALIVARLLC